MGRVMQHIINIEDFKDVTSKITLASSSKDGKRLDCIFFIDDGKVNSYFKVHKDKICVLMHGDLSRAITTYNSIKG